VNKLLGSISLFKPASGYGNRGWIPLIDEDNANFKPAISV